MFSKSNVIVVLFSLVFFSLICLFSFFHIKIAQNQKKKETITISVEDEIKSSIEKKDLTTDEDVKYFGSNIYKFPQTEDKFAERLHIFLSEHTNLEVSAITDKVGSYGVTTGFFVMFREKK